MVEKIFRGAKEFIVLFVIAFILASGIRVALAEVREVPTGSMEPTIEIGDRVFTVKFMYYFSQPKRGEIVVFQPPKRATSDPNSPPFVKRVIGLPGDTVEVRDGKLYVNGTEFDVDTARIPAYTYGPIKVKPGTLFVLGDNRNDSSDSHVWGFVPQSNVIAKAVAVIWPPEHVKVLE